MRTVFIADKNSKTPLAEAHRGRVTGLLREKGDMEILEIGLSDVVPCLGCLLCMTKRTACA